MSAVWKPFYVVVCKTDQGNCPAILVILECRPKSTCQALIKVNEELYCLKSDTDSDNSDDMLDWEKCDVTKTLQSLNACNLVPRNEQYIIQGHEQLSFVRPLQMQHNSSIEMDKPLNQWVFKEIDEIDRFVKNLTPENTIKFTVSAGMLLESDARLNQNLPVSDDENDACLDSSTRPKLANNTKRLARSLSDNPSSRASTQMQRHRTLSAGSRIRLDELRKKDIGQQVLNSEFPLVETICVSLSAFWDQVCEIFIIRETKEEKIEIVTIFFACLQGLLKFVRDQLSKIMDKLEFLGLTIPTHGDTLRKILRQSYPGWKQHLFGNKNPSRDEAIDMIQPDEDFMTTFHRIMEPFFAVIDSDLDEPEEVKKMSTWTDFIINLAEMQVSDPQLEFDFDEPLSFGAAQLNPNYHEEYDRSPNGTEAVIAFPAVVTAAHRNVRKKAQVLIF